MQKTHFYFFFPIFRECQFYQRRDKNFLQTRRFAAEIRHLETRFAFLDKVYHYIFSKKNSIFLFFFWAVRLKHKNVTFLIGKVPSENLPSLTQTLPCRLGGPSGPIFLPKRSPGPWGVPLGPIFLPSGLFPHRDLYTRFGIFHIMQCTFQSNHDADRASSPAVVRAFTSLTSPPRYSPVASLPVSAPRLVHALRNLYISKKKAWLHTKSIG